MKIDQRNMRPRRREVQVVRLNPEAEAQLDYLTKQWYSGAPRMYSMVVRECLRRTADAVMKEQNEKQRLTIGGLARS